MEMKSKYVLYNDIEREHGSEKQSAKRVNIVSVKLVKEASLMYDRRVVSSPYAGYELVKKFLEDLDREAFIVASLDTKNQPVSINVAHIGDINSCIMSPSCVIRVALLSNAAAILVAHNHPSGNPEPSEADVRITERLEAACDLMGLTFLDHLIIGDDKFISLKERGTI